MNTPDSSASAGIFGFLVFFLLGVALWLLMRSMSSRIQKIEYHARDESLQDQPGGVPADEAPGVLPGDPSGGGTATGSPDGSSAADGPADRG